MTERSRLRGDQIQDETITGEQIADESIEGRDIKDGSITLDDINISSTGKALVTRIVAGSDISIESTGVDSGTGVVTINFNSSTGTITVAQHRNLDQLVHTVVEDSYYEIVRSAGKITHEIWWETSAKLKKIREIAYTYSGNLISQAVTTQYDSAGNIATGETYTETYNRTGGSIVSIDGVIS